MALTSRVKASWQCALSGAARPQDVRDRFAGIEKASENANLANFLLHCLAGAAPMGIQFSLWPRPTVLAEGQGPGHAGVPRLYLTSSTSHTISPVSSWIPKLQGGYLLVTVTFGLLDRCRPHMVAPRLTADHLHANGLVLRLEARQNRRVYASLICVTRSFRRSLIALRTLYRKYLFDPKPPTRSTVWVQVGIVS